MSSGILRPRSRILRAQVKRLGGPKRLRWRAASALIVAPALVGVAAAAQEAPRPTDVFAEEVFVAEVLLDVLVTDKRGKIILGLGPEDFIVRDGGEELAVQSVTFYSNLRALDAPTSNEAPPRSDRYFILLFHDQKQSFSSLTARQLVVGRYTRRWIEAGLRDNDFVAVLGYDVKLKIYQDFTHDRQLLARAVGQATRGTKGLENWPSRRALATSSESPSLLANLPMGKELRAQTRKIQQALTLVAQAAAPIVGRKNLLLFSVGFGEVSPFGHYRPDVRYYPPMKEALNDANIAVYSIDWWPSSRGGNPNGRAINDALSLISTETGGTYFFSFQNPLSRISNENSGYYLLSYSRAYPAGSSGYRKVRVSTRNPEFRVQARRGYLYGR